MASFTYSDDDSKLSAHDKKQFDTLQERIAHVQLTDSTGIRDKPFAK